MNNITMLEIIAKALNNLRKDFVFVGGSVAELYADKPELSDIRPTNDIDCIIEISSNIEYYKLEDLLRKNGFKNDISDEAPICRWIYKGIKVDVMPTDEKILGFSNKWYLKGIENKISKQLQDGTSIFILSPEYYLATKFEAHNNRGTNDLRQSHDFEDIIYLLDNKSDIMDYINNSSIEIKIYLKKQFFNLLKNPNILEGIESALSIGSTAERAETIIDIFTNITKN